MSIYDDARNQPVYFRNSSIVVDISGGFHAMDRNSVKRIYVDPDGGGVFIVLFDRTTIEVPYDFLSALQVLPASRRQKK